MAFKALTQKGKIGNLEIKNRIVFPSINNNFTYKAFLTDESIDFYVSKAKGGAGLIITESTAVDYPYSRHVLNPAINEDMYLPVLKKVVDGCHEYGAKLFVQLTHSGRQTQKSATGYQIVGPSAIPSKSPLYPEVPRALELDEIKYLIDRFGHSAYNAKSVGVDGIELILGHGYLMNNFLSPLSNERTDEYGGLTGGIKFCADVIKKIKEVCGADYPIICRINGDDYVKDKGNTIVEMMLVAQELEKVGADALNVSAGMRDSELSFNDHTPGQPRGAWIHLADRIKRVVNIPVMVIKRLSPELAEETIASGKADYACFGKQFIADSEFANKVLEGRPEDVIYCTSCCQGCYDILWQKRPITCMVNPSVGRKMTYLEARKEAKGDKRILVVGGGPSGCEAALELARKGHKVTLIEKTSALGGDFGYCKHTDRKKEVVDVFAYLGTAMKKAGVDVRLSTPFSSKLLEELGPEAVVDATGAKVKFPDMEGINLPIVVDAKQAIDGTKEIGEYVVVVSCGFNCTWTCRKVEEEIPDDVAGMKAFKSYACSAGHAAADVAEELALRGKKVAIIAGRDSFVPGMGFTNRGNMLKRFFPKNITVSGGIKVKKILEDGLLCEKDGVEFKVCADTVVMSVAVEPRKELEQELADFKGQVFRVGDSAQIGNAFTAFQSGYELADKL